MRSQVRSVLIFFVAAVVAALVAPPGAHAAGTIPSHLNLSLNNPSCTGCTVSGTVGLLFDDYADTTGSVIHLQRTLNGAVTNLPDYVVGSSDFWFYDYPQVEGVYEYLATFDGDDLHAPAQATASVTVERQQSYVGMNVWTGPANTVYFYVGFAVGFSGCHTNCEVVVTAATETREWEVARFTFPQGSGTSPTISFKRQGATKVTASYAGDGYYLPAQSTLPVP